MNLLNKRNLAVSLSLALTLGSAPSALATQAPTVKTLYTARLYPEQALSAEALNVLHSLLSPSRHASLNVRASRLVRELRRFSRLSFEAAAVTVGVWEVARVWWGVPTSGDSVAISVASVSGTAGVPFLLHRLAEWAQHLRRDPALSPSAADDFPWPLAPRAMAALYPFHDRIYEHFYEEVDETNPDWRRREILASILLEQPQIQKGTTFEITAIQEPALQAMEAEGLGVSPEHLITLLHSVVRSGLLEVKNQGVYRLRVEPEVAAVKFRAVPFMARQLQAVLKLHRDEPLRQLMETYGAISERWPLFPVDARKPFAMAVALLDPHDRDRVLDVIGDSSHSSDDLRLRYPLLDNLWLMYDRAPGADYVQTHFPRLMDQDLLTLSPESSRFPLGGLGRVQAYHVEGLDYLAQNAMRIMEGEPYYPGSYDPLTQPRAGLEVHEKHRVFTHRQYSRKFKVQVFGKDVTARVYQEHRIFGSPDSPGAISIAIEDQKGYYANYRYEYFRNDSAKFDEFRYFFANAFLDYWEQIQLEKLDTMESAGRDYKGGWLIANDAQSSAVVTLVRERQNRRRHSTDPLEMKIQRIWEMTRLVQVCHTVYNRNNVQTGEDVTASAMRNADLAWMVSGWHAAYLAPKKDPHTRVVGMFNGSAWKRAREIFVQSWKRQRTAGLIQPRDADPDYPTPENLRLHRLDDKTKYDLSDDILSGLAITRRADGTILDPEMPVFSYSGRPVDEKVSLYAANTESNLRDLVNRGKGVNVIFYLSPAPSAYGTYEHFLNIARSINPTSKGKLIVRWGNTPEEQVVLNNISDNVVQPSRPKTEANGSTEVPGGPNGAWTTTPSGLEGGLQVQGIHYNIIIPQSDTEAGFRAAYNYFLTRWYVPELDDNGRLQYDEKGWARLTEKPLVLKSEAWALRPGAPKDQWQGTLWEGAAASVRLSRANEARLTAAEMLRQIHKEEERLQNPLLALKPYLRGEPGSEKYFTTPLSRARLTRFLRDHTDLATPLRDVEGIVRAFVMHLRGTARPFVLAIDMDHDYWTADRKAKKEIVLSYQENRAAFKTLLGERAGELRFTLWDPGIRTGYPKIHQLEKDEVWRLGVPYPGLQVLVPEQMGEDLLKAVGKDTSIVHTLRVLTRPSPPRNRHSQRAWLKILARHLGVKGSRWLDVRRVLAMIGMPRDQRVQVSGLLPTAEVGRAINDPDYPHLLKNGQATPLYEVPVEGHADSRIVIREPMTGEPGRLASIFNVSGFQPDPLKLQLVTSAKNEQGIIGDVTTHLGASVREVVERPALFQHRFPSFPAGQTLPESESDESLIARTHDGRHGTMGFVVYVPVQEFMGPVFDTVRDELSWGYADERQSVRYLLKHQFGIGAMTDSVALDLDRPATWEWMFDQMHLAERSGLDGFRFDLAWHYAAYRAALSDLKARLSAVREPTRRPLAFLEETYQDGKLSLQYHREALEAAKRRGVTLGPDLYYSSLRKELEKPFWLNNAGFQRWIQDNLEALEAGILLHFFSNIDDPTSAAIFRGNTRAIEAVLKVIFLLPGSPALYLPEAFAMAFGGAPIARELSGDRFWQDLKALGESENPVLAAVPQILQATNHRLFRDENRIVPLTARPMNGSHGIVSFARLGKDQLAIAVSNFSDAEQTVTLDAPPVPASDQPMHERLFAIWDIYGTRDTATLLTGAQLQHLPLTLASWVVRSYLVQEVHPQKGLIHESIPVWPEGGLEIPLQSLPAPRSRGSSKGNRPSSRVLSIAA